MKLSKFGLTLTVTRNSAPSEYEFLPEDLEVLSGRSVEYIRGLGMEEIQKRLDTVSVNSLDDQAQAGSILARNGIVIIKNHVPRAELAELDRAVEDIYARATKFDASGDAYGEQTGCVYQKGAAKLTTYKALAGEERPVIQIRQGADKGMIDVFNVDRLSPTFQQVRRGLEADSVLRILGGGLKARNLNVYINKGIQQTRGFHVDSYSPQFKAFLYLTDVLQLDDGPYVYVKGQHRHSVFSKVNRKLSQSLPAKTEAPIFPLEDILPVLAPKGSLVISDQGGIHRGFPQGPGGQRCAAVMNYS